MVLVLVVALGVWAFSATRFDPVASFGSVAEQHAKAMDAALRKAFAHERGGPWTAELSGTDVVRTNSVQHPYDGIALVTVIMGTEPVPYSGGALAAERHIHTFHLQTGTWFWVGCEIEDHESGGDFCMGRIVGSVPRVYPAR
jgi:hypothetical protein